MSGFAGMLTGFFGKLLDYVSSERRHRESLKLAEKHHQEAAMENAAARFADHLRETRFHADHNRQFLHSLTEGWTDSDIEMVARTAFSRAPDMVSWFEDAGGVERFLVHMGLRDED